MTLVGPLLLGSLVGFGVAAGCGFVIGRRYERRLIDAAPIGPVDSPTPEEDATLVDAAPLTGRERFEAAAAGPGVIVLGVIDQAPRWRQTHGAEAVDSLTAQLEQAGKQTAGTVSWPRPGGSVAWFVPGLATPKEAAAAIVAAVRQGGFEVRGEAVHATASFGWATQDGSQPVGVLLAGVTDAAGEAARYGRNLAARWTPRGIERPRFDD